MIDISKLSAPELEQLIADAAKRRAQLQPAVPGAAPEQADAVFDPGWRSVLQNDGNTILQIRHPGFGWITTIIPPHERAHLLSLFLHQALLQTQARADAAPPTATTGGGTVH